MSAVERLSADDQVILWPDEVWPQDIGALGVLDGTSLLDSDGRFRIEAAKQAVEGRLHLLPRFRQVLCVPRRGLGGPLWVDAPAFDLGDHVHPDGAGYFVGPATDVEYSRTPRRSDDFVTRNLSLRMHSVHVSKPA